ncbi:hypothetical protein WG66_007666 [Moniliophthora roreri]|uniref:Uncharacterized protein n=1 Tax=Moniliophthora roreri TaxID=221103 RepID=A0A0W0F3V5_MONRR|nr:hypothetical protein WG66_007666 [Moniliophthora roreri]
MTLESGYGDKTMQAGLNAKERLLRIEKMCRILANEEDRGLSFALLNFTKLHAALATEILSLIFLFRAYGHPFLGNPDSRHKTDRVGWISITHVRHHLRVVALETASLWSSPSEHPSMALEIRQTTDFPTAAVNRLLR